MYLKNLKHDEKVSVWVFYNNELLLLPIAEGIIKYSHQTVKM